MFIIEIIFEFILFIIGFIFSALGLWLIFSSFSINTDTILQQIYQILEFQTGVVTILLTSICGYLHSIYQQNKKEKTKEDDNK